MTYRERMERRIERRTEWATKAYQKSNQAIEEARKITEHIPFGQPILVGHHSEAGHRRAIERSASKMDIGIEKHSLAEYHSQKAEGLKKHLDNSIFDDDPDAIEKLEHKLSVLENYHKKMIETNKICRNKKISEEEKISLLLEIGFSEENAKKLLHPEYDWQPIGFASYSLTNNSANIRRCKERLNHLRQNRELSSRANDSETGIIIDSLSSGYSRITFSEKPDRGVLTALKEAGFRWNKTSWIGKTENIPEQILNETETK